MRTLTVAMLLVNAALSLTAFGSLYAEARYAFEPAAPVDVGRFATAELSQRLVGRYVRAQVELEGQPAIAFRRLGESERRLVLAANAADAEVPAELRFVEHSVPAAVGMRFVAPRLVAGRLSRVGELGLRYRGLSQPLDSLVVGASSRGWVLVDGEDPKSAAWVAGVAGLAFAFFCFSVGLLFRIFRKPHTAWPSR